MKKIFTFLFFFALIFNNINAKTDSSTSCNWKSKVSDFKVWTNCDSNRNNTYLIGRYTLNQNYSCTKGRVQKWIVNNAVVSTSQNLYYKITKNGTYSVCVVLLDSCNRCDTSFCKTISVSCIPGCNWKSKVNDFNVWTNCDSNRSNTYLIGRYVLNNNYTCTKGKIRKWMVNNSVASYSQNLYYKITQNGSYNVCLYLYDSCNKCDTIYCKTVNVNCFNTCNWKSRIAGFDAWNNCDSNKNAKNVLGKLVLTQKQPCSKIYRKWFVNGVAVSYNENLYHTITSNGTYNVCVQLYDSCTRCDTTLCKTVTVNCFGGACNWKNKVNDFNVWTNCDSNRSNTYLIGRFILNKNYTCTKGKKWKWGVNNSVASTSQNLYYKITQNGTYNVCLWLYDSCNNCDTSFCKTVTVNCIGKSTCNWKDRISSFHAYNNCDSQRNSHSRHIIGSIVLNQKQPCSKIYRKWFINGVAVSYNDNLYYQVANNGTYQVCVQLYDSCTRCDTTICKTVTVGCLPGCNWKHKVNDFNVWTNCDSARNNTYLIGRFILNKNYTCTKGKRWKWMVNNNVVSTSQNLYYKITQNGTYNVCLWLYDSCAKCDTSFCKTVSVSCFNKCNWKHVFGSFDTKVTCDSNKNVAYLIGKFTLNQNYRCGKKLYRKWTVNNSLASYGEYLNYPVSKNGMYKVCVTVYDSCNKCDTTYCRIIPVNCNRLSINPDELILVPEIYPNPAGDRVSINGLIDSDLPVLVSFADLSGKLMQLERIEDADAGVFYSTAELPAGIYLVTIKQGDRIWHLKLVKQ